jgi:hypothetical protein
MVDNILRRRRWIVRRRLEGWKIVDIAEALHVNEKTVDRWWSIHRKYEWRGPVVKPHAPNITHRTPQVTVDLILKLRREKRWGPCKIEGYLKDHTSEVSATVGHTTIHKILNEYGLNNPLSRPRKAGGKRSFEHLYSNSLWQADFKMTEKDEWMISYLDDHSRFIPGSRIHHNPTAEHAIKLEESMKQYGKPDQILTDRGTQFYPARGDKSEFRVLHWKQHTTHRHKRQKTLNHRQDRSLPQSLRIRSLDVP